AGSPEFRDLLEEVDMRIKKEGEARCELVDIQAGLDGRLHIGHPISQGERELLDRGRPGLADVIPGNGYRVPAGHVAGSENDRIHHEPHRRFGREDVLLLRDVFLRSEEHTSELQSLAYLVCRLLLEKKKV